MLIPDFRKILKEDQNRYQFVKAVAKRANEVNSDEYLSSKCGEENVVTYALREFVNKKLTLVEEDNGNGNTGAFEELEAGDMSEETGDEVTEEAPAEEAPAEETAEKSVEEKVEEPAVQTEE